MAIKKAYVELIDFLEANENSKVKTILDEAKALCSAKSGGGEGGSTVRRDADGNVTHVFCYYHKMWEDVTVAAYGAKASSSTGLNNMCKEGTSAYALQQRVAKKAGADLLVKLGAGEMDVSEIPAVQVAIEEARRAVVPRADGHGSAE